MNSNANFIYKSLVLVLRENKDDSYIPFNKVSLNGFIIISFLFLNLLMNESDWIIEY